MFANEFEKKLSKFFFRNPEFRIRIFPDLVYMNSGFLDIIYPHDIWIDCSQIFLDMYERV